MRLFEIIDAEHALEEIAMRRKTMKMTTTNPCSTKNGIFGCVVGMFFAWNLQNRRNGSIVSIDGGSNHFRDLFIRPSVRKNLDLDLSDSRID
jgi:hypothetical protein